MENMKLDMNSQECITACVYDDKLAGIWLLYTKDAPDFIANVDRHIYQKLLGYLSRYSLVRQQIGSFFSALRRDDNSLII